MQPPPRAADPPPAVPWSAAEIFFAWFLLLAWPLPVSLALDGTGLFARFYGPDAVGLARADDGQRRQQAVALGVLAGPAAAEEALPQLRRLVQDRLNLWMMVFAFPFQAASIPLVLWAFSRTRPAQLGLTAHRLGRNLLLGVAGFLVLAPVVLALNYAVEIVYHSTFGGETQVHPLTRIATHGLVPAEEVLLVLSGVVAAPVVEELFFRGVLQPWLAARPGGGALALAAALAWALFTCWGRVRAALPLGPPAALAEAAPALFVLALLPVYLAVAGLSRTPVPPAVFGTAVLFAAFHSNVWPSPVALVVLGVGLGVLAWRTRSLVGPVVLHSLFNGVACVQLLWGP
jgi:membrane protease YdiL (CAAX protease family)